MTNVLGNIKGRWYDGVSSKQTDCRLDVYRDGVVSVVADGQVVFLCQSHWDDLRLSSRLGDTPRCIEFSAGQKFETLDNDGVDALLRQLRGRGVTHQTGRLAPLVHLMESKFRYGLLALLVVIAAGSWMTVYGVPVASKWIAHQLPQNLLAVASEQTMTFFDSSVFEESALEPEVKERLLGHFHSVIRQYPELSIQVKFRDGARVGANAFALPDGTVVFTDQMVRLAAHDDELLAVLAHEIGHVYHRHGMRSLAQSSMLAFLLMMMSGDVGATAEIFLALPIFLTEMAYSRDFERESDDFALAYLQQSGIEKSSFSDLMLRLQGYSICLQARPNVCTDRSNEGGKICLQREMHCRSKALSGEIEMPVGGDRDWVDYLQSHPATQERLMRFREK